MMLVPRKNNFDIFDNFFDDEFFPPRKEHNLMKTDIREKKDKYLIDVDLPGYEKENINLSLHDGYLNISAKVNKEEKKEEDIHAEFKNGILMITVPKKELENKAKEVKQIEIK